MNQNGSALLMLIIIMNVLVISALGIMQILFLQEQTLMMYTKSEQQARLMQSLMQYGIAVAQEKLKAGNVQPVELQIATLPEPCAALQAKIIISAKENNAEIQAELLKKDERIQLFSCDLTKDKWNIKNFRIM
jgi:hypothetical protein